jgi:hypothetical protein
MSIPWSSDGWWWIALLVQLLAIPGTLLPLLPGLIWLPVGGLIWTVAVGWQQAWPELVVALVLFGLGLVADLVALGLASMRLKASRWSAAGAGVGLLLGVFGLLPALPFGGPLLGALFGPWLGALVVETWVKKKATQWFGMAGGAAPGIRGGIGCCGRTFGESSGSTIAGAARNCGFCRSQFSLSRPAWSSVPKSWR